MRAELRGEKCVLKEKAEGEEAYSLHRGGWDLGKAEANWQPQLGHMMGEKKISVRTREREGGRA